MSKNTKMAITESTDKSSADWRQKSKKQSRKNQIRSIERMLKKEGLQEKLVVELNEKLKVLQAELQGKTKQELERKRSVRYHKVKFFERRKVERKIETAQKKLVKEDNEDVCSELRKEIIALEDDLTYVMYFPKDKKYISLFAETDEKSSKKIAMLREEARIGKQAVLTAISSSKQEDKQLSKKRAIESEEIESDEEGNEHKDNDEFFVEEPEEVDSTIKSDQEGKKTSSKKQKGPNFKPNLKKSKK